MSEPVIEFSIDVTCLTRLAIAAPKMTPIIEDESQKAMLESGMLLDTMTAARTPVNYGLLRSSIQYPRGFETSGSALDTLRGVVGASDFTMAFGGGVSTMVYVDWVESGTKPHWAPIAPFMIWATRKFGGKEAIHMAYAVRAKIAKKGTPGAHMFQRAWNEGGRDKVTRIWQKVPVTALKRWEAEVSAA